MDDYTYPCWYANLENGSNPKAARWKIGVVKDGKRQQVIIKLSQLGDVTDTVFWNKFVSYQFATKSINMFRSGNKKEFEQWIKNGCPY